LWGRVILFTCDKAARFTCLEITETGHVRVVFTRRWPCLVVVRLKLLGASGVCGDVEFTCYFAEMARGFEMKLMESNPDGTYVKPERLCRPYTKYCLLLPTSKLDALLYDFPQRVPKAYACPNAMLMVPVSC
jgi:hypothetical protein